MHKLLERQINRYLDDPAEVSPSLQRLLEAVSAAYTEADADRSLLERSLELTSQDLVERNQQLRSDVIERTRAATELGQALSILEATLDSTGDGILVVNTNREILVSNRRFAEMWRLPAAVLETRDTEHTIRFVLDQLKNPAEFQEKIRDLEAEPDAESFDLLHFKDGRIYERYSQAHRTSGSHSGRIWCFRDVTERSRIEEELRQSQKLEAIGQLAGGVAHDFNNLLTAISGYAELLNLELAGEPRFAESIEEIIKASERAAGLTRQLLAFSRRQMLAPVEVNLCTVVQGLEKLLGRLIGENISIRVLCQAGLGVVRADLSQIEQVVLNLAVNARDAMPSGGTLTIEARNVAPDDATVRRHAGWSPAGHVMLRVSDTGCGIEEEVRKRVFEPFFTTKQPGKGTGLGLSTVHGIVAQSGGAIWVESAPGRGTVFTVALPRIECHRSESAIPEIAASRGPRGVETVLLAEDEPAVRKLAAMILRSCGYKVIEAIDGASALAASEAHAGDIHLLLTDVVMPGLSGFELARAVARRFPASRVLYISGYTGTSTLPPTQVASAAFLPKPFSAQTLAVKVREVLDATAIPGTPQDEHTSPRSTSSRAA